MRSKVSLRVSPAAPQAQGKRVLAEKIAVGELFRHAGAGGCACAAGRGLFPEKKCLYRLTEGLGVAAGDEVVARQDDELSVGEGGMNPAGMAVADHVPGAGDHQHRYPDRAQGRRGNMGLYSRTTG